MFHFKTVDNSHLQNEEKPLDCLSESCNLRTEIKRATKHSAGFDIPIARAVIVPAKARNFQINTNFKIRLAKDANYKDVLLLYIGRSSLTHLHVVTLVQAVESSKWVYIKFFVNNMKDKPVYLNQNQAIAQIVPFFDCNKLATQFVLQPINPETEVDVIQKDTQDPRDLIYTNAKPITIPMRSKVFLSTRLHIRNDVCSDYALIITNTEPLKSAIKTETEDVIVNDGLIDSDYMKNIKIAVWNQSDAEVVIPPETLAVELRLLFLRMDEKDAVMIERKGGFGSTDGKSSDSDTEQSQVQKPSTSNPKGLTVSV